MNELELHEIAEAWAKLYHLPESSKERQDNFWAFSKMLDLCEDEPETGWRIIHLIRKHDGSDVLLANLAAGPVEDCPLPKPKCPQVLPTKPTPLWDQSC